MRNSGRSRPTPGVPGFQDATPGPVARGVTEAWPTRGTQPPRLAALRTGGACSALTGCTVVDRLRRGGPPEDTPALGRHGRRLSARRTHDAVLTCSWHCVPEDTTGRVRHRTSGTTSDDITERVASVSAAGGDVRTGRPARGNRRRRRVPGALPSPTRPNSCGRRPPADLGHQLFVRDRSQADTTTLVTVTTDGAGAGRPAGNAVPERRRAIRRRSRARRPTSRRGSNGPVGRVRPRRGHRHDRRVSA